MEREERNEKVKINSHDDWAIRVSAQDSKVIRQWQAIGSNGTVAGATGGDDDVIETQVTLSGAHYESAVR